MWSTWWDADMFTFLIAAPILQKYSPYVSIRFQMRLYRGGGILFACCCEFRPHGILIACSCSELISPSEFAVLSLVCMEYLLLVYLEFHYLLWLYSELISPFEVIVNLDRVEFFVFFFF